MRKIEIELGGIWVENPVMYIAGAVAAATLQDEDAPETCQALWDILPIHTRTIHTFLAGQNWRTEGNYELRPEGAPMENLVGGGKPLGVGDVAYRSTRQAGLFKIFVTYGNAVPDLPRTLIAKIDENLEELVKVSRRILYEGPKNVTIRRRET